MTAPDAVAEGRKLVEEGRKLIKALRDESADVLTRTPTKFTAERKDLTTCVASLAAFLAAFDATRAELARVRAEIEKLPRMEYDAGRVKFDDAGQMINRASVLALFGKTT